MKQFFSLYRKIQEVKAKFIGHYSISYNRYLLDRCGVAHHNAIIYGRLYLKIATGQESANVSIGEGFLMLSGNGENLLCPENKAAFEAAPNAVINIGHHVKGSSLRLRSANNITIGNYVTFGANVLVMDTDCHSLDYKVRMGDKRMPNGRSEDEFTAKNAPIVIGDNAFIGADSMVLKGVIIGKRSIIAAGSIVISSIPDDCIAAGVPAKVVRNFSENKQEHQI
jgi:acetyltransferase-like isoleucine patch superfamily enzyme